MVDVPRERLAFRFAPFFNTRIKYFGPFYVSVKRSTKKTVGIHFYLPYHSRYPLQSSSINGHQLLCQGNCEVVARRGVPGVLWSNNGTNVIATEKKLLKNVLNLNQQTLIESLVKKVIKWKFNTLVALHLGSVLERLVHSFKHTFSAILSNRRLNDGSFSSTSCIVKQSLIACPLVPASANATELDALTPNHFPLGISGSSLSLLANCDFDHRKRYELAHV